MRVRFIEDFDYKPTSQSTIAYKAGMEETVRRECGEQAIAAGKAKEVRSSGKTTDGAD
jgi:hypothetical protein